MKNIDRLSDLVWIVSPEEVFDEARIILKMISGDFNNGPVGSAFKMIVDLYRGDFPGYRACNTEYHDLQHTIDTFLAMVRLIHGAVINGRALSEREIALGLISALLHDAGYIQKELDLTGTGAKYTVSHVQRSMDFLGCYGTELGLSEEEIKAGRIMILCTDLAVDPAETDFPTENVELLGKMLGAADLLAQQICWHRCLTRSILKNFFSFTGNLKRQRWAVMKARWIFLEKQLLFMT